MQYWVSTIGGRRGIVQLSPSSALWGLCWRPVGNHASTTAHESLSSSIKLALGSQHCTPMNSAHFSCFLMADCKNQAGAAGGNIVPPASSSTFLDWLDQGPQCRGIVLARRHRAPRPSCSLHWPIVLRRPPDDNLSRALSLSLSLSPPQHPSQPAG